ncbi:MAG TPA: hypothetical protein VLJ57_13655, partial [Burkholderiaceae bacterium]|nr:hypothetical protein [Burkholderiaceae bacterium]
YRGWFVDLTNTRERIGVDGLSLTGFVAISSIIPDGTCTGDGTGVTYCFSALYGTFACEAKRSTGGLIGKLNPIQIDLEGDAYTKQSSTGKRYFRVNLRPTAPTGNISENTQKLHGVRPPEDLIPSDRIGWREIRNFKEN